MGCQIRTLDAVILHYPEYRRESFPTLAAVPFLSWWIDQNKIKGVCPQIFPQTVVHIELTRNENKIHVEIAELIQYVVSCKEIYVYALLSIVEDDGRMRHLNALVFDKKSREMEHFEPHGVANHSWVLPLLQKVAQKMRFRFVGTEEYGAAKGPQIRHRRPDWVLGGGWCVLITIMYLTLRITNLDCDRSAVMGYLLDISDQRNINWVAKFGSYVEDMVINVIEDGYFHPEYVSKGKMFENIKLAPLHDLPFYHSDETWNRLEKTKIKDVEKYALAAVQFQISQNLKNQFITAIFHFSEGNIRLLNQSSDQAISNYDHDIGQYTLLIEIDNLQSRVNEQKAARLIAERATGRFVAEIRTKKS